jgi:hypothetical protein
MSKLLTTLIAIAFAAAASTPVAYAAEKGDTKSAPAAEKKAPAKPKGEAKKGEPKKAPAKPKGEAKKGEPKKAPEKK